MTTKLIHSFTKGYINPKNLQKVQKNNLEKPFSAEPDGDDGKDGGGAEASPGRDLGPLLSLDQPERHPRAAHDQRQRNVNLKPRVET
jgi:hypothetical protein